MLGEGEWVAGDAADYDIGAIGGETEGDCAADAALSARAGYEGDFPGEIGHNQVLCRGDAVSAEVRFELCVNATLAIRGLTVTV